MLIRMRDSFFQTHQRARVRHFATEFKTYLFCLFSASLLVGKLVLSKLSFHLAVKDHSPSQAPLPLSYYSIRDLQIVLSSENESEFKGNPKIYSFIVQVPLNLLHYYLLNYNIWVKMEQPKLIIIQKFKKRILHVKLFNSFVFYELIGMKS